jgi:glutamine synthetase
VRSTYIAGIIKHGKALMRPGRTPTTNSYTRLVPGYEAPVNLAYSARNRSAACRIPLVSPDAAARSAWSSAPPDPAGNPYLTFAAIFMAGIDGIQRKIDPGDPLDKDLYDLVPRRSSRTIPHVHRAPSRTVLATPSSSDHAFLLQGDVFSQGRNQTEWVSYKRDERSGRRCASAPTPHEFELYYDV